MNLSSAVSGQLMAVKTLKKNFRKFFKISKIINLFL